MGRPYRCVLLFGAPGVGKGTQGKRLGGEPDFVHLATGDIFRALDPNSERGRQFRAYSSRGELVPDELTIALWQDHVRGLIAAGTFDPVTELLLLDGMPRSVAQARMLRGVIEPVLILHLVAPSVDEMVLRMRLRAEKEGRHDDADEAVIRRRFDVYADETRPVLNCYDPAIIREIDALGTMDEVTERLRACLAEIPGRESVHG